MAKILIKGGCLLTMDKQLGDYASADILVDESRISHVGPDLKDEGAEIIDARGTIVMPGFVDCHRHMWQTQLRAITADWTLFDYSVRIRSVYSALYQPEDVYLGCYAGFLEAINAGTTTIVDHCHIMNSPAHADAAVKAFKDAGLRGIFCFGLFNNPKPEDTTVTTAVVESPPSMLENARRVRSQHFAAADGLVSFGIAMTETEWFPMDYTRWQVEFSRELGAARIVSHVGMAALSQRTRFIDRLHRAGLLGPDLLFVHGSGLSDKDLKMIARCGASVVSTPETELQMGMGFPVLTRVLRAGAQGALGIDIASNNSADMFTQLRLGIQVQRALENDCLEKRGLAPKELRQTVRQYLEVATLGGARAIGLDDRIGSLTPGKDADLIMIRADGVNMVPVIDPASSVALCANVGDVDTVMVAGKVLKRGGRLQGVDWPDTARRLQESSRRILKGGEAKGFETPRKMMEMIFPISPRSAREARLAGAIMRLPVLREPLLKAIAQQIEARSRRGA